LAGRLFVKICGITNLADAEVAAEAGADALGFVFYPRSPRFLDLEKARHLLPKLPGGIMKVGVFVDEPIDLLTGYIEELPLDYVQLHGTEQPDYCDRLSVEVIKGLRIGSRDDIRAVPKYRVSYYLLDTLVEGLPGGTGKAFDWEIAVEARENLGVPILLSGGLNPQNVGDAVRRVRPAGVDVSSGVEASPGRKDHKKVKDFIGNAREAGKASGRTD
jgi:phosphoribosylanthranilate isomerase